MAWGQRNIIKAVYLPLHPWLRRVAVGRLSIRNLGQLGQVVTSLPLHVVGDQGQQGAEDPFGLDQDLKLLQEFVKEQDAVLGLVIQAVEGRKLPQAGAQVAIHFVSLDKEVLE